MRQSDMSGSPWREERVVRGFVESPPNQTLLRFASGERVRSGEDACALDIGCGAARNARPLVDAGWHVVGVDTSLPMLEAAAARTRDASHGALRLALASMSQLPFADRVFDFVIAHGVWNLATSDDLFRTSIREASRVLKPGGGLFVFTFSRHTLGENISPVSGERYVYDQFSGARQVFVTAQQLIEELHDAGFEPDASVPLTEHNRAHRALLASGGPVIYEGAFRRAP
jgi:ubiquinone/menaquinone biosynthesis C-methylase UbiE